MQKKKKKKKSSFENLRVPYQHQGVGPIPLNGQYHRNTKAQPRPSPFRPDLSETKWRKLDSTAQGVHSMVYSEGFHVRKYLSKFPCVLLG